MQERSQFEPKLNKFSIPLVDDRLNIREILHVLVAGKWIIFSITLAMLVIGSLYAINITPQYQSSVLLQIENKSSEGLLGSNKMFGSLGSGFSPADVHIALIKSRFILLPVVESLGLDVTIRPHYFPIIGQWLARQQAALSKPLFGLNKYAWGGEIVDIRNLHMEENFEKSLKLIADQHHTYKIYTSNGKFVLQGTEGQIAQIKKGNKIEFSIFVKKLKANPGTEFYITKLSTENLANQIALQLQIMDLGQFYQIDKTGVLQLSTIGSNPQALVSLLNTIANFSVQKDTERKSLEAAKTLKFLTEQLPIVKRSLNFSEQALNKYRMQSGTIDITFKSRLITNQLVNIQKEIIKVNLDRLVQLQKITPIHPYILALESKKAALQSELLSLEKELQTLPATDQIAVGLIRDIKVQSQLYLMLLQKIHQLQIARAGTISEIRILSLANLPTAALPTGRILIIFSSILIGLVIGSLLVFFRKVFHHFVEDPNWLEQHFGIPIFAIVPYSREQNININFFKEKKRNNLPILAHTKPLDLSVESLRSLRTSLQFALIGAKNNIISIMGISPGIGKSFVTVNFAHILAESGKRVILIDGDIRKGYLHSYFSVPQTPGITEVISAQKKLETVIQKTHLPNLDFISSGKFPPNPSELLISNQFKEILEILSSQYDLVIIDTAPILAVTDGVLIGKHSGLNFLIYACGKHQAEEIELTVKRLQNSGVAIQGAIFNYLAPNIQTKGRFNYYYAYGEAEKI